jgi:hypothetical protein
MTARRGGRAVSYGLLAIVAVIATCGLASASSTDRELTGKVTTFPQGIAPNLGSGLLRTGHHVYYEMVDENGNTTIGRIDPRGRARTATTSGSAYIFSPPTRTSDGGIWVAVDSGGGGAAPGDTPNLGVAGLDPRTWHVRATSTPGFTLDGWPSVADRKGRFWTQGNAPGEGIVAVGDGLKAPLVSVTTQLGPLSSETDQSAHNPIVLGPDRRIWLLGGDGTGAGLRITAVDPTGIKVDVAPESVDVGALALVPARGRLWTVGADATGKLVAVGVGTNGSTTSVSTILTGECDLDLVRPVYDGHGELWFTGADASCSPSANLLLAAVDVKRGAARSRTTGLTVLDGAVSTVIPVSGGVIVAGLDAAGNLAFARVTPRRSRLVQTDLRPWVAPGQGRYPLVGDGRGGAWAQAVDSDGKLVVVHVTRTNVRTVATDLTPRARELEVGPDRSLWTQGLKDRRLVLVKVGAKGGMTLYPTGESPTQFVLAPAPDGAGNLWFRAAEPKTGELVLVRVGARS